jgi:hypothetical protein
MGKHRIRGDQEVDICEVGGRFDDLGRVSGNIVYAAPRFETIQLRAVRSPLKAVILDFRKFENREQLGQGN